MTYDHRTKAGNQGDVIKHVALLAAARHAFGARGSKFRYADAYAGPSGSLLFPHGGWRDGIGKLDRSARVTSVDVANWMRWYLARPQLAGSRYPGSALIVADAAVAADQRIAMSLWDISDQVVEDLRQVFPDQMVMHAPVDAASELIQQSDLLFIDPPTLSGGVWETVLSLVDLGRHMLAWLPINVAVIDGSPAISAIAKSQSDLLSQKAGISCTRLLWAYAGRTIGCLLAYRSTPEGEAAIRCAVEEVVTLCAWKRKDIWHTAARNNV